MRFFNKKHEFYLQKCKTCAILLSLSLCLQGRFALNGGENTALISDVTVKIEAQDALQLNEFELLKMNLMQKEKELQQLTLKNKALSEEKAKLQQELIDVSIKLQKESESYRNLKVWLSKIPLESELRNDIQREEQQLSALSEMRKDGYTLALQSAEFSEQMSELVKGLPLGKIKLAEFEIKQELLSKSIHRFMNTFGVVPKKDTSMTKSCKILSIDRTLSVVILSAGSLEGLFPGMVFLSGKDKKVRLQVISVRPRLSAALILSREDKELSIGMDAELRIIREPVGSLLGN